MTQNKISKERWLAAQAGEFLHHFASPDLKDSRYKDYVTIFSLLSLNPDDFSEKSVLEVGPAFYPALSFFKARRKVAIEPLYSKFPNEIKDLYLQNRIEVIEENYQKALNYINYEQNIINRITEVFKFNKII